MSKQIAQKGELFFFDYGVVVMYGLTEEEERDVLRLMKPFEEDKINEDEVETEELHFHYNTGNQPRIYNGISSIL